MTDVQTRSATVLCANQSRWYTERKRKWKVHVHLNCLILLNQSGLELMPVEKRNVLSCLVLQNLSRSKLIPVYSRKRKAASQTCDKQLPSKTPCCDRDKARNSKVVKRNLIRCPTPPTDAPQVLDHYRSVSGTGSSVCLR